MSDFHTVCMPLVAVFASYANAFLFSMVFVAPSPQHREYDVLLGYQTAFALVQMGLLGVLCPRTLYLDGCFLVAFHGLARHFSHELQVFCFSILVVLATNNVTTTALSFTHRLLVIMGKKFHVLEIIMLVVICFVLHATVMVLAMATEDWSHLASQILYNHTIEENKIIGFNIRRVGGWSVMSLTLFCPPIVCVLAYFLYSKGQTQLSSVSDPAIRNNRFLHAKLLKVLFWQAVMPSFFEVVVVLLYFGYLESNQASGQFEWFYFGAAPVLLLLQAVIPLCVVVRYKRSVTYPLTGKVLATVCVISAVLGGFIYHHSY